jgi:nucleoside-diphosphate-sugar epimerase
VIEALARGGFAEPVAGIRTWSRVARIARDPVAMVPCNILDRDQVQRAVAGVQAIVHCAYTDDRESIVGGTRNVLAAAAEAGIDRLVMLSSAEVYGPAVSGTVTEDHPARPSGRLYADAKIEAEEACRAYAERGIPATILRPSLIYGPFGTSWTTDVARRLLSRRWAQFDEYGDGIANLVYVDDLVQAILRSLDLPQARGETFNVNGPEQPTWNEYFRRWNDALGLPPLARMSAANARLRSRTMDLVSQACGAVRRRHEERLMRIYLRGGWASRWMKRLKSLLDATPRGSELNGLYRRRAVYSDEKLRRQLGYAPQFDLETGLRMSKAWLCHIGQIDEPGRCETLAEANVPAAGAGNNAARGRRMEDAVA